MLIKFFFALKFPLKKKLKHQKIYPTVEERGKNHPPQNHPPSSPIKLQQISHVTRVLFFINNFSSLLFMLKTNLMRGKKKICRKE